MRKTTEPPTAPLIRLAHPLAFAGLLRKVGAPVDRLFAHTGLPVYCDDPGAFVPLRRAWALFDAAAQLEDSALGWHVGRFVGDAQLSSGVLRKIEHAPTLYQALYSFIRLARSESSQLDLRIVENRDNILFYTRYPMKDWSGYTSSQAYQLAVYIDIVRHYAGRDWMPPEIGIEAPIAPPVIHEHYPDSRIVTGHPFGYIAIPRSCLHYPPLGVAPIDTGNDLWPVAARTGFVGTVKAVAQAYLADGYPSAHKMAEILDTSERSLFRGLADHGVAYQTLLDEVRIDAAKRLLREEGMTVGAVASHLGFSDASNFARMFRRVCGLSPREYSTSVQT
jgi:AraC-like DNA-binding protein